MIYMYSEETELRVGLILFLLVSSHSNFVHNGSQDLAAACSHEQAQVQATNSIQDCFSIIIIV